MSKETKWDIGCWLQFLIPFLSDMETSRSFIIGGASICGCELDSWNCIGRGMDAFRLEYTWNGWKFAGSKVKIYILSFILGFVSGWVLLGVLGNGLGNTMEDSGCWGK